MYRSWVLIFIPWPEVRPLGDGGWSPCSEFEPAVRGRRRTADYARKREGEKRDPVFVQIWLMSAHTTFYLRHRGHGSETYYGSGLTCTYELPARSSLHPFFPSRAPRHWLCPEPKGIRRLRMALAPRPFCFHLFPARHFSNRLNTVSSPANCDLRVCKLRLFAMVLDQQIIEHDEEVSRIFFSIRAICHSKFILT